MRGDKRLFSFFFCVLLVFGTFLPFIFAQETGKTDSYTLNVEVVGRNVLFVNEQVSLKTSSNASQVLVQIFDRLNTTQYSKYVAGNSTFAWLPPVVYGLFTVKASVGEQVCATWFWLQDTRGFSVAPSTSIWGWQGLTCNLATAVSAGKVSTYNFQVARENGMFETEWLSEVFSNLKPTEYSVEANAAGCVHIKTYSAKNQIDSWVMNTWFGVKIRVNGTLEKPTTFKWALKAVSGNVLWQVGGLRVPTGSGNLVYDWSDMDSRSTGVSYVLDKMGLKLDVYLQSSFDLDPTIFSDGFESGDFNAWTETGVTVSKCTLTVQSTTKHHGTYAASIVNAFDGDNQIGQIWKTLGAATGEIYVRVYFYFQTLSLDAGTSCSILCLGVDADILRLKVGVKNVGGTYYLALKNTVGGSRSTGSALSTGQWYCVELQYSDASNFAKVYLNGVLDITVTDGSYSSDIQCFFLGERESDTNNACAYYADCVVAADAYIGPESTGTNYNIALSLATAMSYTLTGKWQAKNALTWQTPETYTTTRQWNAKTTATLSTPLSWTTAPQTTYKLALPFTHTFSWLTTSKTAYGVALPFAQGFTWLLNTQANYKLVFSVTPSFTWLLDVIHIPHAGALYIIDLAWNTPFSWTTQLQATFNVAFTWVTQQTWLIQSWIGVSHVVDLAWQSSLGWAVNFLNIPPEALDGLVFAVLAFIIALAAIAVAIFWKTMENRSQQV
jgi:hypothetical protein